MRRPDLRSVGLGALVAVGLSGSAYARERAGLDGGIDASRGRDASAGDAGAIALGASQGDAPPLSDEEELPDGHPAVDDADANPRAHAGRSGAMPGVFQPPDDVETPDPSMPPGTIVVELHDADDHPVPNETITLGILINSIAKGDSRKHLQATTNDKGVASFSGLEIAGNIAYRVSSGYEGGSFAASPFQLGQAKSMHVVLHVYPVTRDMGGALIVCEATVAAELKDDRIQVEEALTVYNLGRTAWQPDDVRMSLPEGFTAFNGQATMSDQGVDENSGSAKLRGTFPPGRHPIEFRWQLPWSGDKDVDFDVGLPPHVAIARVMMPATSSIKLSAVDFPAADLRRDEQGQSFLVTEKRLRPDDAKMSSLSIGLHDLPTPGPGRDIAVGLAALGIGIGLYFASTGRMRARKGAAQNLRLSRDAILEELAGLERAHASGEVGPRTYERARHDLMVSLAHALGATT
jgi:hypothetical protein